MSLRYWWPLAGDYTEKIQGNDLSIQSNSGKINSSATGKIAQVCAAKVAIGCTDYLRSKNTIPAMTDQTIAAWVYVNTEAGTSANGIVTNHSHQHNTGMGITLKVHSTSNIVMSCNTGNGSSRTYYTYYGTTHLKGKWHHLCLTYSSKDTQLKLYVDGVCEKTQTYTMAFREDYLDVFGWSTTHITSDYKPAVQVQDVRVYDHALSQTEVRDLAQGLVYHITGDDHTINNSVNDVSISSWSSYSSYWTISSIIPSINTLQVVRPSSSTNTVLALSNSTLFGKMAVGDVWAVSCYLYKNGVPYKTSCTTLSTYSGFSKQEIYSDETGYFYVRLKIANKDSGWIFHAPIFDNAGVGELCEIRHLQFYKVMDINNSAGLMRTSPNLVVPSKDCVRGSSSLWFNGSTSCVEVERVHTNMFIEPYTLSFWVKPEDDTRAIYFGDYNMSGACNMNFERQASGGGFRYYHNGTNIYDNNATTPVNQWTMITIVYYPGSLMVYKNGSRTSTTTHTATITKGAGNLRIGRDSRSDNTALLGKIDDFRWYSTSLSDEEVRQLYDSTKRYLRNGKTQVSEVKELDVGSSCVNKKSIQKLNFLTEVIQLEDGSYWLQVMNHDNKGATNLFSSSDAFATSFVYHNSACWSAFPIITNHGLYNGVYEFIAIDDYYDGTTRMQRWAQNTNPVTSTSTPTISSGSCSFGGLRKNGTNTFMSRPSNWWAATGSWNSGTWGNVTGVPGYTDQSHACAGRMCLFVRVSPADAQKYREFRTGIVMPFEIEEN